MKRPSSIPTFGLTRVPIIAAAIAVSVLASCALPHDSSHGQEWGKTRLEGVALTSDLRHCTDAFSAIDDTVRQAGTGDAQAAPVPGFPHLRTTRFLAAMGSYIEAENTADFEEWTNWLAHTAVEARKIELANVPRLAQTALDDHLGGLAMSMIQDCTETLLHFDKERPESKKVLLATVNVPDNYIDIQRVIGLYPLTAIPVLIGFETWKSRNLPSFSAPPSEQNIQGKLLDYAPRSATLLKTPEQIASLLRKTAHNPLNIPRPAAAELLQLAAAFAPIFTVDDAGDYDRIGKPTLVTGAMPIVDMQKPVVYIQPTWTLFGGTPLLQISYLAWFTERPPTGNFDILSGALDGLIWRVTLAPDGQPLLYDSIHPCGCYHLFFPVPPVTLKAQPVDDPSEGTIVPINAPALGVNQRMRLHISSGDHYLRALSVVDTEIENSTPYAFEHMDNLRRLPLPSGGTKSLYDPDGLIAGTDRGERFLLWPMGVASPGAMRQWGTHATAFVGRRHFDDPYLLDKAFQR